MHFDWIWVFGNLVSWSPSSTGKCAGGGRDLQKVFLRSVQNQNQHSNVDKDEDFNDEEMMATFAARLQAWTPAYVRGKKLTRTMCTSVSIACLFSLTRAAWPKGAFSSHGRTWRRPPRILPVYSRMLSIRFLGGMDLHWTSAHQTQSEYRPHRNSCHYTSPVWFHRRSR